MTNNCYALVITPHPDDAEYGIAGTVAKWVREGKEVVYAVCTNGNKGTPDPNMKPEKLAEIRQQEQQAAARVLGVKEVVFLHLEDQALEDTPEFRKQIVRLIRTYKPEVMATSDPYRRYIWHRDHRITGQVVLDAVFPYARDHLAYPDLLEAGLQPHKVKEVLLWGAENPNYFSDISDTYDIKMQALHCHKSQVGQHPTGWEELMKQRYESLAEGKGFKMAEAFYKVDVWW
ncbi:MAG: PIG-L family deacetylase [Chloroflexi bacterium]|nr:PIG-L family deacetylase [Chloroflexota bacterium]MBM3155126.1 PIG-L family deacetylase [Chloroflexota bacterium]MBM3175775.1 PIG-L family deacetylase [Chloroflexota bacterium]MBM4451025.1 PIG-L family deacetylase [Chloroflexota bacterium]